MRSRILLSERAFANLLCGVLRWSFVTNRHLSALPSPSSISCHRDFGYYNTTKLLVFRTPERFTQKSGPIIRESFSSPRGGGRKEYFLPFVVYF